MQRCAHWDTQALMRRDGAGGELGTEEPGPVGRLASRQFHDVTSQAAILRRFSVGSTCGHVKCSTTHYSVFAGTVRGELIPLAGIEARKQKQARPSLLRIPSFAPPR